MNFCVTDGESVVVTRYISSKKDEAASLVSHGSILRCLYLICNFCSGSLQELNSTNMLKVVIIG